MSKETVLLSVKNLETRYNNRVYNQGNYNEAMDMVEDDCIDYDCVLTPEQENLQKQRIKRGLWSSKTEFLLSCIGLTIGTANFLYFPSEAARYGGMFLIVYAIVLALIGTPLFAMKLSIAQFCGGGPVSIWKCVPVSKGIGISMMLRSFYSFCQHIVFLSFYTVMIYYTANSDEICPIAINLAKRNSNCDANANCANVTGNFTESQLTEALYSEPMKWPRVVASAILMIPLLCVVVNGSRGIGSAVYYTATLPYMFIVILIVRSCTLDGAVEGLRWFFDFSRTNFFDFNMWRSSLFILSTSLGLSTGEIIVYGSYNRFKNNCIYDAITITVIDFVTSVLSCIIFFTALGHVSLTQRRKETDFLYSDTTDAYNMYLLMICNLPAPQLWLFIFGLILILLVIDTIFGRMETVVSVLIDEIPYLKTLRFKRFKVCLLVAFLCFLITIPQSLKANNVVSKFMVKAVIGWTDIVVLFVMVTSIVWIYGIRNFSRDIEFMVGFKLPLLLKISWSVVCPLVLLAMFISKIVNYVPPVDRFEWWLIMLSWLLFIVVSVVPSIAFITYTIITKKDLKSTILPEENWGPADPVHRKAWLKHINKIKILSLRKQNHENADHQQDIHRGSTNPSYDFTE
ncbi:Uncharacterised protein g6899 [Pycnogonum litorale]